MYVLRIASWTLHSPVQPAGNITSVPAETSIVSPRSER